MAKPTSTAAPITGSTNKSTPAPAVVVSPNVRKWVPLIVITFGIIWGIANLASIIKRTHGRQQSSEQQQVATVRPLPQSLPNLPRAWNADGTMVDPSTWPRVIVPPYGDSLPVPVVFGSHVVWGGSGFKAHCVYADGHEGIIGDRFRPCSDGDMVKMYARNDGGTLIYASYAYARPGER